MSLLFVLVTWEGSTLRMRLDVQDISIFSPSDRPVIGLNGRSHHITAIQSVSENLTLRNCVFYSFQGEIILEWPFTRLCGRRAANLIALIVQSNILNIT
jgi:hypothetical protein